MNYKNRVRKQDNANNWFAMALFGCITIAVLMATMGCNPDEDVMYGETEKLESVSAKAKQTYSYEPYKNYGRVEVTEEQYLLNSSSITRRSGEFSFLKPIDFIGPQFIYAKPGKYIVTITDYTDRTVYDVEAKVKPNETVNVKP